MSYLKRLAQLATGAVWGMWLVGVVWMTGVMFVERLEGWMSVSPVSAGIFTAVVVVFGSWLGITTMPDRR